MMHWRTGPAPALSLVFLAVACTQPSNNDAGSAGGSTSSGSSSSGGGSSSSVQPPECGLHAEGVVCSDTEECQCELVCEARTCRVTGSAELAHAGWTR